MSLGGRDSADPEVDVCLTFHEIPEGAFGWKWFRATMESTVLDHVAGVPHHQNRVMHFGQSICFCIGIIVP